MPKTFGNDECFDIKWGTLSGTSFSCISIQPKLRLAQMKFLKFSLFLFSCSWALSVQAMCRNEPEGVGLIETKVIRNNLSRDFS